MSNRSDIDVFGFAVDLFSDTATLWGGSSHFHAMFEQFPGAVREVLNDFKALLRYGSQDRCHRSEAETFTDWSQENGYRRP